MVLTYVIHTQVSSALYRILLEDQNFKFRNTFFFCKKICTICNQIFFEKKQVRLLPILWLIFYFKFLIKTFYINSKRSAYID